MDTLAQDSTIVVDWRKHCKPLLPCCWGVTLWRVNSVSGKGPEPRAETEVQPNFQYVEYKRVFAIIPVRPTPVIVLLVFPSWFPRVFVVSLIVGTILYFLL